LTKCKATIEQLKQKLTKRIWMLFSRGCHQVSNKSSLGRLSKSLFPARYHDHHTVFFRRALES
jgi:hypothetical protein